MAALFLKNKRGLLELPMTTDQTIDELVQLSDIQRVSRSYVTLPFSPIVLHNKEGSLSEYIFIEF